MELFKRERLKLTDSNPSVRNKAVLSILGRKRITSAFKKKNNLSANTQEAYDQIAERQVQQIDLQLTSIGIRDLFKERKGRLTISYNQRASLINALEKTMKFKPNQVLRFKVGKVYYSIGNNANRERFVEALNTNFEVVGESVGSDMQLVSGWNDSGEVEMEFKNIKGKVGGGYFEYYIRKEIPYMGELCRISQIHQMSDCVVDDNKLRSKNCLQHALTVWFKYKGMEQDNAFIDVFEGMDNVDKRHLSVCRRFDYCLQVKQYYPDRRTYTNIYNEGGSKVIEIALILGHYIACIPCGLTSYFIEYHEHMFVEKANEVYKQRNDGFYRRSKDRFITADEAVALMLERKDVFFKKVNTVPTFVSEQHATADGQELYVGLCEERKYQNRKKEDVFYEVYADTETNTSGDSGVALKACICAYAIEDTIRVKTGDDCCFAMLDDLIQHTTHTPKILFHNLKFDISVMLSSENKYVSRIRVIKRGSLILYVSIYYKNRKIVFQDTYSFIALPLSAFSKTFGLNCKKERVPYKFYTQENIDNDVSLTVEEFRALLIDCYGKDIQKELRDNYIAKTQKHIYEEADIHDKQFLYEYCLTHEQGGTIKALEDMVQEALSMVEVREGKVNMMEYYIAYCIEDVKVLRDGFELFRKTTKERIFTVIDPKTDAEKDWVQLDVLDFKSIASLADAYLRVSGCYKGVYDVSGITRVFVSEASIGGRVQSYGNEKYLITNKRTALLDGVSLYPSSQYRLCLELGGVLLGMPKLITDKSQSFLNTCSGYFVEIRVLKVNTYRGIGIYGLKLKDRRLWCSKELEGCYIKVDKLTLEMLMEYNDIQYEIIRGYYYDEGRNPMMGKVVNEMFQFKANAKSVGEKTIYKLMLNSCYGYVGLKAQDKEVYYVYKNKFDTIYDNQGASIYKYEALGNGFVMYEKRMNIFLHYNSAHIACEILSMSKKIMNEVVIVGEDLGVKTYYTDTDSLHISYDALHTICDKYRVKYGHSECHNYGVLTGKKLSQFHNDFVSDNILMTDKEDDIVAYKTILLGAKVYLDCITNKNNIRDDNGVLSLKYDNNTDYHMRCKGVNDACLKSMDVEDAYTRWLNNETLECNLNDEKPSFKLLNFEPKTNKITRRVGFNAERYIHLNCKVETVIHTTVLDVEKFEAKRQGDDDALKRLRRIS